MNRTAEFLYLSLSRRKGGDANPGRNGVATIQEERDDRPATPTLTPEANIVSYPIQIWKAVLPANSQRVLAERGPQRLEPC